MYSNEDFKYFTTRLTSNDPHDRGRAVGQLIGTDVIGDKRLLPLLEPLLEDERITMMPAMPPRYCEIRWMAAKAIGTQRRLLKLPPQKISRIGFVFPGSYGMLYAFAVEQKGMKESDIPYFSSNSKHPKGGTIKELEYLKKLGVLPVCTSNESPYLDYSTLSISRY